jgi:hypothetical protein
MDRDLLRARASAVRLARSQARLLGAWALRTGVKDFGGAGIVDGSLAQSSVDFGVGKGAHAYRVLHGRLITGLSTG